MTNELTNQEKPSFLVPAEGQKKVGAELLSQYQRPSFLKIVQALSDSFKPQFSDGDLIVTPENIKISGLGEPFHFVPIFFYREWCIHNPLGESEFIRERTLDENHPIAIKARARSLEERELEDGGQYVEHLNFVVVLLDHNDEIQYKPLAISFFKGEWKTGANLATLIDARDCSHICGIRMQGTVGQHRSRQYKWFGLDVSNPLDKNIWISDEKMFTQFCSLHDKVKETFETLGVQVDYGQEESEEESKF